MTLAAGSAELEDDARGGVEVEQVGEAQFLALMDGDVAEAGRPVGVPGRGLVRVLAVSQRRGCGSGVRVTTSGNGSRSAAGIRAPPSSSIVTCASSDAIIWS